MSNHLKTFARAKQHKTKHDDRIKLRKHLHADKLISDIKTDFTKIVNNDRGKNATQSIADALMCGFAMFSRV